MRDELSELVEKDNPSRVLNTYKRITGNEFNHNLGEKEYDRLSDLDLFKKIDSEVHSNEYSYSDNSVPVVEHIYNKEIDYNKYNNLSYRMKSKMKSSTQKITSLFYKDSKLTKEDLYLEMIGIDEVDLKLDNNMLILLDKPFFNWEDDYKFRYSRNKIQDRIVAPSNVRRALKNLLFIDSAYKTFFEDLNNCESLYDLLIDRCNVLNKRYLLEPLARYFLLNYELYNEDHFRLALVFSCMSNMINPHIFIIKSKIRFSDSAYINRCKLRKISVEICTELDRFLDMYLIDTVR